MGERRDPKAVADVDERVRGIELVQRRPVDAGEPPVDGELDDPLTQVRRVDLDRLGRPDAQSPIGLDQPLQLRQPQFGRRNDRHSDARRWTTRPACSGRQGQAHLRPELRAYAFAKANGSAWLMKMPDASLAGSIQKRVFQEPAQPYVPAEPGIPGAEGWRLTPTPRP